jgi:hypothetical protein
VSVEGEKVPPVTNGGGRGRKGGQKEDRKFKEGRKEGRKDGRTEGRKGGKKNEEQRKGGQKEGGKKEQREETDRWSLGGRSMFGGICPSCPRHPLGSNLAPGSQRIFSQRILLQRMDSQRRGGGGHGNTPTFPKPYRRSHSSSFKRSSSFLRSFSRICSSKPRRYLEGWERNGRVGL